MKKRYRVKEPGLPLSFPKPDRQDVWPGDVFVRDYDPQTERLHLQAGLIEILGPYVEEVKVHVADVKEDAGVEPGPDGL